VSGETTILAITRGTAAGETHVEEHVVPYEDGLTLLDAIIWIRRHTDPSIAVRFSCKANACKECSATIDGKPGFLCAQRAPAGGTTRIEPLKKPRHIRDLVTELY
jgi:succinate dehydrogenase/fumarate reductase-like Fe-S protein